jgi:hypothetical protein
MSPVARAGVRVAPDAVRVALAGVRVALAEVLAAPAVRAALVNLADPPDLSGRSATRSSSPTPCASSPT